VLAIYCWKVVDKGYNFALNLIAIGGLHTKLWGSKVMGISTLAISRLPLGSPGTKCHLDVGLMKRHIIYYKEEGGGFPQVWAVVSLVSSSLLVARPSFGLAIKVKVTRLRAKRKPKSQGKEVARVRAKKKPGSHITYS
jgi:hypothetical protein